MLQERLPKQTLYAEVSGKKLVERPRTRQLNYFKDLGRNLFGFYPSKMLSVLVDREVSRLNLELLLLQLSRKLGEEKRRRRTKR